MKAPKAEKVATFKTESGEMFILKPNLEAIQETIEAIGSLVYPARYFDPRIKHCPYVPVEGHASLLSRKHFGHQNAFMPSDGGRFAYYFNEKQILYVKASGKEGTVVMKSGNEYRVKVAAAIQLRNLIARDDIKEPEPEKVKATKKLVEAPDLEELEND